MSDEIPRVVRDVWDDTDPGPVPDLDALRAAKARTHYRSWVPALGVAAALAAIVLGVGMARLVSGGTAEPVATPTPKGVIGLDRIQVDIPTGWPHLQPRCFPAEQPYFRFVAFEVGSCPLMSSRGPEPERVASVALGSTEDFPNLAFDSTTVIRQSGLSILVNDKVCDADLCHQAFRTDGVWIGVSAPPAEFDALVAMVRDSIAPIPDGYTAVPYVTNEFSRPQAIKIFEDHGLKLRVVGWPPSLSGVGFQPDAGRIVPIGSTIVTNRDGPQVTVGK